MKKIIYLIILFCPLSLFALEKTKEEKVAKYIIERSMNPGSNYKPSWE